MQHELHMEILGGKEGGCGLFEELKSNGAWFRVDEE